jgi:hypothetical protein
MESLLRLMSIYNKLILNKTLTGTATNLQPLVKIN